MPLHVGCVFRKALVLLLAGGSRDCCWWWYILQPCYEYHSGLTPSVAVAAVVDLVQHRQHNYRITSPKVITAVSLLPQHTSLKPYYCNTWNSTETSSTFPFTRWREQPNSKLKRTLEGRPIFLMLLSPFNSPRQPKLPLPTTRTINGPYSLHNLVGKPAVNPMHGAIVSLKHGHTHTL